MPKDIIKNFFTKRNLLEFFYINCGIFLVALANSIFIIPNNFTLGGVTGISILISPFLPSIPVGIIMLVLNIIVLIFGFIFLGKSAGARCIYGSLALSIMVSIISTLIPLSAPLTNDKLLELIYSVFLPGLGVAIVFTYNSTTGGTEIIAKIMNKYLKIKLSLCLLILDFTIASLSFFIFDINVFLYSILGVCMKIFILDLVMENINMNKIVVITSPASEEIKNFIINDLHRGATLHHAKGLYTNEDKEVITTILSKKQAIKLQTYIDELDVQSFVTITNSSRILGNGFRRMY